MLGDLETRVLEIERRLGRFEPLLLSEDLRAGRLNQMFREAWLFGGSSPCGSITDTVTDSNTGSPISGKTVQLKDGSGSVLQTGTTDGSGVVTFIIYASGPYIVTAVAGGGYAEATTSLTATCSVNNVTQTLNTCTSCNPTCIPKINLTLTLDNIACGTGQMTLPLTWTNNDTTIPASTPGLDVWVSPCFACNSVWLRFKMSCSGGTFEPILLQYTNSACTGFNVTDLLGGWTVHDFTASPLFIHYLTHDLTYFGPNAYISA